MTFFHEKSAVLNGLEHIGIKSRSFAEKIEIRILICRHIGIYLDDFVNLHVFGVPTGYGYPAMRVLIGKIRELERCAFVAEHRHLRERSAGRLGIMKNLFERTDCS